MTMLPFLKNKYQKWLQTEKLFTAKDQIKITQNFKKLFSQENKGFSNLNLYNIIS